MTLEACSGLGAAAAVVAARFDDALAAAALSAWNELGKSGQRVPAAAAPPRLKLSTPLRQMLAHAIAAEEQVGSTRAADLWRHYLEVMPRLRVDQLAGAAEPGATFFHTKLDWSRLPRLTAALERLFGTLAAAQVDANLALGFSSAAAFRRGTATLAELYERTHYGGSMPLLYGYPADLRHFYRPGSRGGSDVMAAMDRYLTAPILHELCHFAPSRDAIFPLYLDECIAGWLGVFVFPEFAYPQPGEEHDDAIFAAPWLAQVGQAMARAFGVLPLLRAHAGAAAWSMTLPRAFLEGAAQRGWQDWLTHRPLHFLSNAYDPAPWLALILQTAPPLSVDDAFERSIVTDGLRAMCLHNALVDGSFRTITRLPGGVIEIDALAGCIRMPERDESTEPPSAIPNPVDVPPRYFLPPLLAQRLLENGISGYTLRLDRLDAIEAVADALCAVSPDAEPARTGAGYTLTARLR